MHAVGAAAVAADPGVWRKGPCGRTLWKEKQGSLDLRLKFTIRGQIKRLKAAR